MIAEKFQIGKVLDLKNVSSVLNNLSLLSGDNAIVQGGEEDPIEQIFAIFKDFDVLVNKAFVDNLVGLGVEELLKCISGQKSFSDLVSKMFDFFKIDGQWRLYIIPLVLEI